MIAPAKPLSPNRPAPVRFVPVLPARRTCQCPAGRHCPNCPNRLSFVRPTAAAGR